MSTWNSRNRHKYLLQYHIIFVCKYRKQLFLLPGLSDKIKELSRIICVRHDVTIKYMETDKDHIHYMMEFPPTLSVSSLVRTLKAYTTYHVWRSEFADRLNQHFWRERTFWTDGYFVCSIGSVSEKTLKEYIENQG
ncbi:IS200/IS605 family transposase [Succinatimonas hippei]|uniref:Transposase-like protein n=1 Tax=Succinatimonas hippei (strain DSM 22608 / JCM 16073 / KCTC 15190 / YIT 12066) TaxID=762983 RepID=E8LL78_SUCHY|nr:transposase-like protein [Succinatimonas hippei YIT 12066]